MKTNKHVLILLAAMGVFVATGLLLQLYRFYQAPGTPRWVVPHLAAVIAVVAAVFIFAGIAIGSAFRRK